VAYVSFEDLEVWKRSCRLAVEICSLVKDSRDYILRDQMSRAAISIASNIAEGAERGSNAEFIRFLNIAKGSAAELRTQLYITAKLGSIFSEEKVIALIVEVKEISKMLQGLVKSQKL
jgi:four helix bundle protein